MERATTGAVVPEDHRIRWGSYSGAAWALVAIGFVASLLLRLHLNRHSVFSGDDWLLTYQGLSLKGFIEPYNGHLSISSIALYRASAELFGINNILPLRVFAEVAFCAIAVVAFVHVKERAGLWLALPVTAALLFYPGMVVAMSAFNHYLGVLGIIVVAWLLPREGRRTDWAVFAVLCLALASSGVAVAGAVGCLAYITLAKVTWIRRVAVAVPVALWLVWYLIFAPAGDSTSKTGMGTVVHDVWRGMLSSQRALVFDNHVLGALLGVVMVILLLSRLAHGFRYAAFSVSWFIAAIAWWVGLSQARLYAPALELIFRYRFTGSVFVVLALLPQRRSTTISHLTERVDQFVSGKRPVKASLAIIVVVFVVATPIKNVANPKMFDDSAERAFQTRYVFQQAAANLGPSYVADGVRITGPYFYMSAEHYRKVVAAFGAPTGTEPKNFDEFIVTKYPMKLQYVTDVGLQLCEKSDAPVPVGNWTAVRLVTRKDPVVVRARLVGKSWTTVGTLGSHQRGWLVTPELLVDREWQIYAPGACVTVKHRPS